MRNYVALYGCIVKIHNPTGADFFVAIGPYATLEEFLQDSTIQNADIIEFLFYPNGEGTGPLFYFKLNKENVRQAIFTGLPILNSSCVAEPDEIPIRKSWSHGH